MKLLYNSIEMKTIKKKIEAIVFCNSMIFLTFMLLSTSFLNSQTVVVPAANTNSGSVNDPLGSWYGYERSAMIYTSAQIGATTGNISSLAFYLNSSSSPGASTDVRIYMKMRTTLFTAVSTYNTETTGATLVYGPTTLPSSAFSAAGWITIPLTTSFNYTGGTNHLEIIIETNTTGGGNEGSIGKQFRYSSPGNNQHYQSWNADTNPPTVTGTRSTNRPNVQLTFTSVVPCSGTPIGGTTVLAPNSGAISSVVNGTVSGSTTGSGLTYQWQYSDDGSTWVNISGQTGATLTTTAISTIGTRQYRRSITCSGTTSHSTPATYTTLLVYCTTVSTFGDNISGFSTTGGITNISNLANGGNNGGYTDFYSSNSVSQYDGFNINFTETYNGGSHGFSIWIDFNSNGTFEAGERVFNAPSTANGHTGSLTIPAGTAAGDYRMRIRGWWGNLNPDPCTSISYGEAEDYKLTVVQSCAAVINSVTSTTICGSGTSAVSVTGNVSTTSINLYSNATGGTALSSITGDSGTLTSPSISSNTTYYVEASNGTCQSIRIPVNVVVTNLVPSAVAITRTNNPLAATACNLNYAKLDAAGGSLIVNQTDTKINYGFETTLALEGWSIVNSSGNSASEWAIRTSSSTGSNTPRSGSNMGDFAATSFGGQTGLLISPVIDLGSAASATLSFWYINPSWGADQNTLRAQYRTSSVSAWQTIATYSTNVGSWTQVTLSLSNLSSTYQVAFEGTAVYGYSIVLDDIIVTSVTNLNEQNLQWTPITDLYTDASLSIPYTGGHSTSVFAAPSSTRTYTVTASLSVSSCEKNDNVTISVQSTPTATITSTNSTICHGNTVALTGTVTTPNSVVTIDNGVGAVTAVGTTWSVNVSPTTTTTYSITSVTNAGCTGTGSGTTTVTLPTAGTTLSQNGESATCIVNGTNIINFYHSSGRLIASINPNGQNLGSVTATSYVDAGLAVPACGDPTNPNYVTATMGRHWVITPTNQPASAILVGLPFTPSEYSSVAAASLANVNPNDNLTGIGSLKLSKYSGTNEDALFSNNCGNGTTTLWSQSASGNVTAYIAGFNATDQYAAFSIPSFSEFWLHGSTSSPLPVKLTNFSATCDKDVTLNWTTASEQNSDRFIVEKSRDGQTWNLVATQTAAGTSNTSINYTQTDENSWNGVTYYRLRQIDFNGAEEVYGPISVSCENEESTMTVYPNPNNGSFTVEIESTEMYNNAQLFLTDLTGKTIASQKVNVANGTTQILINDLDLKMGTYLVTLRGADQQLKPVKVMVTK